MTPQSSLSTDLSSTHIYITTSPPTHGPLRRSFPLQAVAHPLLHRIIASRIEFILHHLLHHLTRKAHKVVPPQRILKQPVLALALLPLQQLLVAKLARADPQVAAHSQQVEANLRRIVAGNAALQHVHHLEGELFGGAGPVRDGRGLQAVQLVQHAVDGRVGDEVEDVLRGLARALRLVGKGAAAREAVVHLADEVRVAEGLAAELGRQHHCEVAEILHLRANVDLGRLVHEHAEKGLRGAGVLYGLRREEDALRGIVVKGAVEGAVGRGVGPVGWELEEEDDAVEGLEGQQLGRVEREELFELDVFDSEIFYKTREHALVSMTLADDSSNTDINLVKMALQHTASDSTKERQNIRLIRKKLCSLGEKRETYLYSNHRSLCHSMCRLGDSPRLEKRGEMEKWTEMNEIICNSLRRVSGW